MTSATSSPQAAHNNSSSSLLKRPFPSPLAPRLPDEMLPTLALDSLLKVRLPLWNELAAL